MHLKLKKKHSIDKCNLEIKILGLERKGQPKSLELVYHCHSYSESPFITPSNKVEEYFGTVCSQQTAPKGNIFFSIIR